MVDHTPTDETVIRNPIDVVAAIFDLEPTPAATISAQEIAEMIRKLRLARAEVHTLPNSAARLYGDAADAIEALTAENARLTSERDDAASVIRSLQDELRKAADAGVRLMDERRALKAEVERLTSERDTLRDAVAEGGQVIEGLRTEVERLQASECGLRTEMEAAYGDLTNSLMTGFSHGRATAKELEGRIARAKATLEVVIFGQPANWYARHRSQVEAAHAAAKEDEAYARVSALYEAMEADQ